MTTLVRPYDLRSIVSFGIFLLCIVLGIVLREPWILAVPFAWILLPIVYHYIITRTANLFWLLLIVLPLSTELNLTSQLGMDFPDELLMMLLAGITIVKIIHQPAWFPRALSLHPLFFLLLIYLAWVLFTCIYSVDPFLSFKYLLAKTWYIIPFVLLPQRMLLTKSDITKMAICLLAPMLFVVVQVLLRHAWYGFSFEDTKYVLKPFFRNHVNYSAMLVCLLAIGWCMYRLTPAGNPARRWLLYGLLTGLTALVFAYSRGAWIALLMGIAGVWLIRKKLMGIVVLLSVVGVVVSTVWLVTDKRYMRFAPDHDHTVFHTDFGEHMAATVNMKDISTAERFYRWIAGARMLADKPVTGFGPNSFYHHYRPYTVRRFETWVSDNPEHSTVHNYFLLTALEQGVAGLVLFCLLFFGMLLYAQRLYHRLTDNFYKMIALTVGVILIMTGVINFMSDMIETDKIGSIFWLCLGMIILLSSKLRSQTPSV